MIKDQVIEINFVKSAENDSDIMTKNQQGQHYMYAKSKLVYTVQQHYMYANQNWCIQCKK